ncbi:MAG: VOC family protein [Methylobacteriaceae bacterium]|nr:VOC family protein [Methylobacteriaceae bacterium]
MTVTPLAIIPYLTQRDAKAAIAFYATAFGAEEVSRQVAQDGQRLMHTELRIGGATLMMADAFPEWGGPPAPSPAQPSPVAVTVALGTPEEVDAMHDSAVAAGATSGMAPHDAFWGARFATVTDPFGHRWMINGPMPA